MVTEIKRREEIKTTMVLTCKRLACEEFACYVLCVREGTEGHHFSGSFCVVG